MTTLYRLTIDTPSDREIVITRVFDAPRQMLFDAFTKPELISQWLTGPSEHRMPICEVDLRVGGAYRYVWQGPEGFEISSQGIFREVVPPERVVATEKFQPSWYEGENINTTTFVEKEGKTTVSLRIECRSQESRDAMLKTGMERGLGCSYDRLETMLQSKGSEAVA